MAAGAEESDCLKLVSQLNQHHIESSEINLLKLLNELSKINYRFIVPTPVTHARFLKQLDHKQAITFRHVFGWNVPFSTETITPEALHLTHLAGIQKCDDTRVRSNVRVASIENQLFLHSAYPTEDVAAVFFGPDTYRFNRFVESGLAGIFPQHKNSSKIDHAPFHILDIGCGSGAGGIMAAKWLVNAKKTPALRLNDLNPLALYYSKINAAAANIPVELVEGDFNNALNRPYDLIIANPPYMSDAKERTYRHGGELLGLALSLHIVDAATRCLAPGGQLMLYTGVAIVDGVDPFAAEVQALLKKRGFTWTYCELDPDVFGEELLQPPYQNVERIAVVGLIATAPGGQTDATQY
jgi:methylase of polypeptide subunit release factors